MYAPMTSSLVDLLALNEFGGHSLRRVAPENTLEAVRQGKALNTKTGGRSPGLLPLCLFGYPIR